MTGQFSIEWVDHFQEPKCKPNPDYPNGIDLDMTLSMVNSAGISCTVNLPYPAKRCGHYMIGCKLCHLAIGVTTAGRPDDPRSVKMPCRLDVLSERTKQ
jgi:hypothetical protein